MAVFDEKTVVAIVRNRLGDVDASRRARILWAIPQALDAVARAVATNPKKRAMLLTKRDIYTSPLTNGAVDLQAYMTETSTNRRTMLIEYLRYGRIWMLPSAIITVNPLTHTISFTPGAFSENQRVQISSSGNQIHNIEDDTDYYLVNVDENAGTAQVSATVGGDPIPLGYAVSVAFATNFPECNGNYWWDGSQMENDHMVFYDDDQFENFVVRFDGKWYLQGVSGGDRYVSSSPVAGEVPYESGIWNAIDPPPNTITVGEFNPGSAVYTMTARDIDGPPLQYLPSVDLAHMDQVLGDSYRYYWLDNYILRVKGLTSEPNPVLGVLAFSVPFQPEMADFASLDDGYRLAELHEDLIKKVIEVCQGPGVED